MNICIAGTGYVGLVTGTCFAEMGNNVWCVDIDEQKIESLKSGTIPIFEPGLQELVIKNQSDGRLIFTTKIQEALEKALFCFIAVGTPPGEDGSADVSHVLSVARSIGQLISRYVIVVNKSTVPVGTAERVRNAIREQLEIREADLEFDVVSNPEFLKEGAAVDDFMAPDRIIIGTDNVRTAELMKQLYEPFMINQHPILIMDIKSAEITKYAANAMLATRISFMNEIARLCDTVGGDITSVRQGIGTDSRIGMPFLNAGIGYGGSCFPKDIRELVSMGEKNGLAMDVIRAVEKVNEEQKHYLSNMVQRRFGSDLSNLQIGIWGLAFKPLTDDMREAPSITIMSDLLKLGAKITAYDPEAMVQARRIFSLMNNRIVFADSMMDVLKNIDALILVTEWRQFRQVDFGEMKKLMKQKIIFDGRNQYVPEKMRALGFEYYCVGRKNYVS
jgi:UDPglucose 6-dehydrogenase